MLTERFNPLFQARSVAIFGASGNPGKWGYVVLRNLINGGFSGPIYPINPDADKILGKNVYRSLADVPQAPDLAVIVVPPPAVLAAVRECAEKGVPAAVIITAGFAELGEEGNALQEKIVRTAREKGMMLVGPNCNGFMSPWHKLYIDFPSYFVPPGGIAVVGQSGGIMDGFARQIMMRGMGCSLCVASGNEADLHMEDYLAYLAKDENTKVILCYIEGFKDGKRFFQIAREVTRKKPVIVFKAGRTKAGAQAAKSHTASLAGDDAVFDGICRQTGIIRARNLHQMLNIGAAFLYQPLAAGSRIGVITAGGGWGVMTADECAALGMDIVSLPRKTINKLDAILPPWWNRGNPIDLVAGTSADNVTRSVEIVLDCPDVDAVIFIGLMPALVINNSNLPQDNESSANSDDAIVLASVEVMKKLSALAGRYQKPVVVSSEHLRASAAQEVRINYAIGQSGSICYQMPHEAAEVMAALINYGQWFATNRKGG